MPRVVRNFWVEAEVDGRKEHVTFGPTGKGGEMFLTIRSREEGGVSKEAVTVWGRVKDGKCELIVDVPGHPVVEFTTDRD